MNLKEKKILVIGLGKTGIATARFLIGRGARVVVTDEKPRSELKDVLDELESTKTQFTFGDYSPEIISGADLIIPSPGVPPANILLREAATKNIPIISEIELAYRFLRVPMIAITGTNGKTTTTTLTGKILAGAGKKVFVGGNIGNPLIAYVDGTQNDDYAVVEVSSFQLQWIRSFRPLISVLLNTTCDHVDYHGSFEAYRQAKERIFENKKDGDLAILNADDPRASVLAKRLAPGVEYFSSSRQVARGMCLDRDALVYHTFNGTREVYPLSMVKIPGHHNIENVMASIMAARHCECPPADIIRTVEEFPGIPHRIEFAAEKSGVAFYDDSKGTNVGAVARALETFSNPVILLMGGRDKEGDFDSLSPLVRTKVKELVLFGEARNRIQTMIGGLVSTSNVATLKEAIETAYRISSPGDVVLLSPGCASFDEFSDYKERGRFFKDVVKNL